MVAETRSARRAATASLSTTSSSSNNLTNNPITCLSSSSSSTSTSMTTSHNTRSRRADRGNVRASSPSVPRSSLNKTAVRAMTQRSVTVQSSSKLKNSSPIMSSYSSSTSSESSRSSSTFSTSSEDSVSSLNLSSLSLTSTTDRSISCPPTQFTPIDSHITWYKSQRGVNICMDGYTYQVQGPVKAGVKWKCHLNRDPNIKCPCFITTSANTGTSDSPIYTYIKATTNHNHPPDVITQKINIFISKLKDLSSDSNTGPSLSKYYQLVAQMKFTFVYLFFKNM